MFNRIKEEMYVPLVFTMTMNTIAYNASRIFTTGRTHYDMTLSFDRMTPVWSWTILIYLGSFAFWAINYVIGAQQDREEAYRLLAADICAKIVCMIFFLAIPTTNIRPVVENHTICDWILNWIYSIDAADNLFPSIHCLTSCFCFIAVRKNPKIPMWYRVTSFVIAAAIYVSTLTTKQHVIVDVLGGVLLAEGMYWLMGHIAFPKWYAKKCRFVAEAITKKFFSKKA